MLNSNVWHGDISCWRVVTRMKQLSIAAIAAVIWLQSTYVKYWPCSRVAFCWILEPFRNVIDKLCFTKEFNYLVWEKINEGTFNSFWSSFQSELSQSHIFFLTGWQREMAWISKKEVGISIQATSWEEASEKGGRNNGYEYAGSWAWPIDWNVIFYQTTS